MKSTIYFSFSENMRVKQVTDDRKHFTVVKCTSAQRTQKSHTVEFQQSRSLYVGDRNKALQLEPRGDVIGFFTVTFSLV